MVKTNSQLQRLLARFGPFRLIACYPFFLNNVRVAFKLFMQHTNEHKLLTEFATAAAAAAVEATMRL